MYEAFFLRFCVILMKFRNPGSRRVIIYHKKNRLFNADHYRSNDCYLPAVPSGGG